MHAAVRLFCVFAALLASAELCAQATDYADERARLGNERARLEAERRASEAEQQAAAPAPAAASVAPAAMATPEPAAQPVPAVAAASVAVAPEPVPDPAPEPAPAVVPAAEPPPPAPAREASSADLSRALEQLRELGELKDAGYITDEEFERIKARILEGQL